MLAAPSFHPCYQARSATPARRNSDWQPLAGRLEALLRAGGGDLTEVEIAERIGADPSNPTHMNRLRLAVFVWDQEQEIDRLAARPLTPSPRVELAAFAAFIIGLTLLALAAPHLADFGRWVAP